MDNTFPVDVPLPRYRIGETILALINHQPRYARVERAFLTMNLGQDAEGFFYEDIPAWEYLVTVFAKPTDASEMIIIAEKTIIMAVDSVSERGA